MGPTATGIDDSDDNNAAAESDPIDDDDLEKWIPFSEDGQHPVSCDCEDLPEGVSEEFTKNQNVDWYHPDMMMTTLRIALLLKTHNNIVRFDNSGTK